MKSTPRVARRLSKLQDVDSLKTFCMYVRCSEKELRACIENPQYTEQILSIPGKKKRRLEIPNELLMRVQRAVNVKLQIVYRRDENKSAYGFLKKRKLKFERNAKAGAEKHVGRPWLWNIDIEKFFPSINTQAIYEVLRKKPFHFSHDLARYICLLFIYKKHLPTGAPTSPLMSHFVCMDLDAAIRKYIEEMNEDIVYTRYADDISFSFMHEPSEQFKNAMYQLVESFGFVVNRKKDRLHGPANARYVTGIKVNEKLNVNRRYIRNIRAALYDLEKNGLYSASRRYFGDSYDRYWTPNMFMSLRGKIRYIMHVRGMDDEVAAKLNRTLEKIAANSKYQFQRF